MLPNFELYNLTYNTINRPESFYTMYSSQSYSCHTPTQYYLAGNITMNEDPSRNNDKHKLNLKRKIYI